MKRNDHESHHHQDRETGGCVFQCFPSQNSAMPIPLNEDIAGLLDEVARLFAEQGANRFRVQAYHRAAAALRELARPVSELFAERGLAGLEELPGVGESIARSIRDVLLHGKLAMLDRLRGQHDPIALLCSVPGIGKATAWKLYEDLEIESLEELEAAAHDGRLGRLAGFGPKRLAGIRDSLAHRLGRVRPTGGGRPEPRDGSGISGPRPPPSVAELLAVDREYRDAAAAGTLKKIAPRRFNPTGEVWLPVLHTARGQRHYTALFSNTPHAHRMQKTMDWVVLFQDGDQGDRRWTIITSEFGRLQGRRIVRGREPECEEYYRRQELLPGLQLSFGEPRVSSTAAEKEGEQ
jgi:DNA polymerase (family 10)